MVNDRLGDLRRSSVVMTFGPGSVVDFRADGAAISAVTAGLEEWDSSFRPPGLDNPQQISEPRLQKKLAVSGFLLPPVTDEDWPKDAASPSGRPLPAVRFPEWLHCPKCARLAPADSSSWGHKAGRVYRYCSRCTERNPGQRKVFVIPVRFVMACPKGHLTDFPWQSWVGHKDDCEKEESADLYLESKRPGLSGLVLSCSGCGAQQTMDGVFSARRWRGTKCGGQRPWLATGKEKCDHTPRVLQRAASNLYFPIVESALSIPPWSDKLQEALGIHWNSILEAEPEDRAKLIRILAKGRLKPILAGLGLNSEELAHQIKGRLVEYDNNDIKNIRQEEYRQLLLGTDVADEDAHEFEARIVSVPETLHHFFSHIVRIVRLREVRALKGFTRINPPGDEDSTDIAEISAGHVDWLPAIEVRGEGIFLAFNQEKLRRWEMSSPVVERARKIHEAWCKEWRQRHGEGTPAWGITPRYLLTHTFAHALMCQLTLESGYSTASLRERLYVSDGADGMAGFLIYTATSDSDGTLGGLQRQGEAHRIERTVRAAVQAMEWCSSDPLCLTGSLAGSDRLSLAACHACILAPETACEKYNQFLDRALLVGWPDAPDEGFFSPLLQNMQHNGNMAPNTTA